MTIHQQTLDGGVVVKTTKQEEKAEAQRKADEAERLADERRKQLRQAARDKVTNTLNRKKKGPRYNPD